ncbi:hypothetical protein KC19_11G030000 [Ceratodon purpureus]|uniref:Uncharacterized protein n=1 Tax=Ceratodon purpureus TaxID=3225 RepID=A0A8T0GAP5_CERPU|nr:hypothetical protein KC19_11G030000 [Ceratodon purpureus]
MQEMDRKGLEKPPRVKRTLMARRTGAPTTPASKWKVRNDKLNEVIMAAKTAGIISAVVPPTPSARKLTKSLWDLQDLPLLDGFHACLYSPNCVPNNSSQTEASPFNSSPFHSLTMCSPLSQPDFVYSPTSLKSDRHSKTGAPKSLQRLLTKTGLDTGDVTDHDSIAVDRKRHIPCSVLSTPGVDEVESGHNVTTSQELFKLFSQIRILEERHNESLNLTTALHAELMQAHARVRELELPDRMARREVERLQKTHRTERMNWRVQEKEKIKAAVQSVMEELEEERKEKNMLENANHNLTKELKEAQTATANALHELESERKKRQLLEDVCTELTQEAESDKAEVEEIKRQSEQVRELLEEERRMLQLAEVWREERVQMKFGEARLALEAQSATLDVMRAELESFLARKRNGDPYDNSTFRDAQVLHDVITSIRYDTSVSTFPPTSSMSSNSSNSSFAPTSEYMYGATLDTDSGEESRDHGHALMYYPEGIPDAD